jgi:hypothetical protein
MTNELQRARRKDTQIVPLSSVLLVLWQTIDQHFHPFSDTQLHKEVLLCDRAVRLQHTSFKCRASVKHFNDTTAPQQILFD